MKCPLDKGPIRETYRLQKLQAQDLLIWQHNFGGVTYLSILLDKSENTEEADVIQSIYIGTEGFRYLHYYITSRTLLYSFLQRKNGTDFQPREIFVFKREEREETLYPHFLHLKISTHWNRYYRQGCKLRALSIEPCNKEKSERDLVSSFSPPQNKCTLKRVLPSRT